MSRPVKLQLTRQMTQSLFPCGGQPAVYSSNLIFHEHGGHLQRYQDPTGCGTRAPDDMIPVRTSVTTVRSAEV